MLIEIVGSSGGYMNDYSVYEFSIDDIICIERRLIDVNRVIDDNNIVSVSISLKNGLTIKDVKVEDYRRILSIRKSLLRDKRIDSIIE